MSDWKRVLAEKGPQIALTLLAARAHGPHAAASFLAGLRDAETEAERRARQQQSETRAGELHQAQLQNYTDDNARAEASQKFQRFQQAVEIMDRYRPLAADIPDAVGAENAMMQRAAATATAAGLPPDQFTGMIPNMAPVIAKGARADAADLLAKAAAQAKVYGQSYNDTTVSFQWEGISPRLQSALVSLGHPAGQAVKPSSLEKLHGIAVAPGPPQTRPRSDFDEFYESEFLPAEIERRTQAGDNRPLTAIEQSGLRLKAREAWNRAGAAGTAAGRPSARSGLTRPQRIATLRDRAYNQILNNDVLDDTLTREMERLGLDPVAEERKARKAYNADLASTERSLRPPAGRGGFVSEADEVALAARREQARQILRGRGGRPATPPARSRPTGGRGQGSGASNSVTLAEVREVARETGWTEQAVIDGFRKRGMLVVER